MKVCIFLLLVGLPSFFCKKCKPDRAIYYQEQLAIERKMEDTKYLLRRNSMTTLEIEDLAPTKHKYLQSRNAFTDSQENVQMYFYSRSNVNKSVVFNTTQAGSVRKMSNFCPKKKTLFIIHGWRNDFSSAVNVKIKAAVFKSYDVNIFVVDWSEIANKNYFTAAGYVQTIGRLVGDFIKDLSKAYKYDLSKIQLVGHSLGAHVAGVAGKHTNGLVSYIMGLDPAGPLFGVINRDTRLADTDAKYVEAIHTCGKLLGYFRPIAKVDYYPNGGLAQPGCGVIDDIDGSCSHSRAYELYAESIANGGFVATKCSLYFNYLLGHCENNMQSLMGTHPKHKNITGKYYLETNPSPPYAIQ